MMPPSIPASAARSMNTSLSRRRSGSPNDTLDRPPVRWIVSPYSARSWRAASSTCDGASGSTATGSTSGSTYSRPGGTWRATASSTMATALATRSSALAGMPPRPLAARITAQPVAAASSRTSGRSTDAELSSSRPAGCVDAATPAARTATSDESIETGTAAVASTTSTSQAIARARVAESDATSSALRSSQSAPAASCRAAIERM